MGSSVKNPVKNSISFFFAIFSPCSFRFGHVVLKYFKEAKDAAVFQAVPVTLFITAIFSLDEIKTSKKFVKQKA